MEDLRALQGITYSGIAVGGNTVVDKEKAKKTKATLDKLADGRVGKNAKLNISYGSETEYQVGLLALVFITIAISLDLVFYFDYFRFLLMIGGLILALIICRNVGFKFTWSKKEIVACMLLLFAIGLVLVLLMPLNNSPNPSDWGEWSNFLQTTLFAPVSEEIVFRLFLLNLLLILTTRRFQAILISSILFMTIHISRYYTDVPALMGVFAFSILAGIVFLHVKNLSATIAMHSAYNILYSMSMRGYAAQYPSLLPIFLWFIFLVLFAVLTGLAFGFYAERNSGAGLNFHTLRRWFTKRENRRGSGSGFTMTCLAFLVLAFYVYLLPFTVTVNLVSGGIVSESFYLLGALGWSQFQVIRYYNLPPYNYPQPVPDPLLFPFVTIIFVIGILFLGIDALIRRKQRRSEKSA